jgi:predicted aspartyl protease
LLGQCAALAVSASGAARAQALRAEQPLPPDTASGKVATQTDAEQHLTIEVKIDGKGPFHFVVDTGADRTIIAEEVAAQLGLLRGKQVLVEGIVRTIPAGTATVNEIAFGPVVRRHLSIPVLPRLLLGADGYLGLDTIDGYRVTLDFKGKALTVDSSRPHHSFYLQRPEEARISAYGSSGHLRAVDCRADGIYAAAFIDTGAEVSAGNPPLFAALMDKSPSYSRYGVIPLTGVTGGVSEGKVTVIDRISISGIEFSNCPIVIAGLQVFDTWGLTDHPALLIGMNYLRQFSSVSIDYGIKEIRLDLASLTMART